jgi:hypothetical protein
VSQKHWVTSGDINLPWDGSVPSESNIIEHAFDLDDFKYYYDDRTGVYHAIKRSQSRYVNGKEILSYSYKTAQEHAAFSVDKDFNFVKPIGPPGLEVRLLAMKQAIEVHQIMMS